MLDVKRGHRYLCTKSPDRYSGAFGVFYSGKIYTASDDGIIKGECGIERWVTWECNDFIEVQ